MDTIANIQWDNETIVLRGTMQRYIFSLFTYLWPIIRTITPPFLISRIYKKYGEKKIGIFLSFLCTLFPFLLFSGDNIAPFTGLFLCLIVIRRLYKKRGKFALVLIAASGTIAMTAVIISKIKLLSSWRGTEGIASLAQFLNAYFPSIDNIAITIGIVDPNKLKTLFYDLYYTIPFKETLLGLSGNNLSALFTEASSISGHIIPWGAQIAHYTTILFSPVITGIFVYLALKAEGTSRQTDNFWLFYTLAYFSFFTSISISIYSVSIYLRNLLNVLLPMVIATSIMRYRKRFTADFLQKFAKNAMKKL